MPVTAGALITSVCINGSIGLACFSLFAVLRQWRVTAKLYKPKRYIGAENLGRRKPAPLAAELPAGLLSWIKPVWCYSEPDVIDLCGLDVAVFFRLLQLGVRLFCFIAIWCLVFVMPVNYMGGYLERHKKKGGVDEQLMSFITDPSDSFTYSSSSSSSLYDCNPSNSSSSRDLIGLGLSGLTALGNFTDAIHTNLDLLTLGNVPPGSRTMWVHLVSVYVITLVALKLLWDLSRDISFKRAVFLAVQGGTGPGSSVLVADLPGLDWGTPMQRLQLSWLQRILPAGLFRRGFNKQRSSSQRSKHRRQQSDRGGDLSQPLLSNVSDHVQQQQQQQQQGADSPAGPVVLEVTSAGASSKGDDNSRSGTTAATSQAGTGGSSSSSGDVGPPVVQDVWQEAVDVLQNNGGNMQELVDEEMRRVYGSDSIAALVLVHDTAVLDTAAAKYFKLQEEFEDVLDWYQSRLLSDEGDEEAAQQQQQQQHGRKKGKASKQLKRKTVLVVGPRHGSWGIQHYGMTPAQVDALEFYPAVLQEKLRELVQLQHEALYSLPRPAAVVTFRRQLVATLAAASLHSYDETAWSISPAPAPDEMIWDNLGLRSWEVAVRQLAVWGVFWLLVLFYAPIVAAIQAPVNMDNLKKIPVLCDLLDLPLVSSILQGFLPSLVLLTFLAVLPYLLWAIITRAGHYSKTAADAQLNLMYFLFQLFAVFIFSFISGTALSQLQALLDDPKRVISLLGVSAPQQASFFSTYILLLGLSRTPLQLLRLPQLGMFLFRLQLANSPRQKRRLWANQQQMLGWVLPLHTLVLLLGLVFCVASPLIAVFTLMYFVSATVCQRYQWLYVYGHPYEGAGTLWKQVFTQVVVAVYFFVAVMGCLLGIKRFEAALLLLPLAVGVLVFHVLAGRALERPLTLAPSREAAAMDSYTQHLLESAGGSAAAGGGGGTEGPTAEVGRAAGEVVGLPDQAAERPHQITQDELQQLYLPPAMKLSMDSLQPLLDEADSINRRLRAAGY